MKLSESLQDCSQLYCSLIASTETRKFWLEVILPFCELLGR